MQFLKKDQYPYQIIIVDFIIFAFSWLLFALISRPMMSAEISPVAQNAPGLFIPIFILLIFGFGFPIYIEKKFNQLKSPRLYLYLWLVIAVNNLISVIILPNQIPLVGNYPPYEFTPLLRMYSILCGIGIGFIPFLFFYLIPRRIRFKKYLNYLLYIILISVGVLTFISFITDFDTYMYLLKNGLSELSGHNIKGLFYKNAFGTQLMLAIFAIIILDTLNHRPLWLLLIIPCAFFQLLSYAKMPILITLLTVLIYLGIKIYHYAKKSKDNLIIVSLGLSVMIFLIIVLIILMSHVQSGLLFKIKKLLDSFSTTAQATWYSRTIIWESVMIVIKPAQILFGYSLGISQNIVHRAYALNPKCPEDPSGIIHSHNTYIQNILDGGIIYLLINVFLFFYLIYRALKIRKINLDLCIMSIVFVVGQMLTGIVDYTCILNDTTDFLGNFVIILPIMALYNLNYNHDEIEINHKIVKDAEEVKNNVYNNFYLKIEQKLILIWAKKINEEFNYEDCN